MVASVISPAREVFAMFGRTETRHYDSSGDGVRRVPDCNGQTLRRRSGDGLACRAGHFARWSCHDSAVAALRNEMGGLGVIRRGLAKAAKEAKPGLSLEQISFLPSPPSQPSRDILRMVI